MGRRSWIFGVRLDRDVIELILEQDGLISRRVICGEKDSLRRKIEISAVKWLWTWMFQPCILESVDKANGRNTVAIFMLLEPRVPDSVLFRRNIPVPDPDRQSIILPR